MKVFHADPLTCRKCGGKLEVLACLHDLVAIKQVLAHERTLLITLGDAC